MNDASSGSGIAETKKRRSTVARRLQTASDVHLSTHIRFFDQNDDFTELYVDQSRKTDVC